MVLLLLLSPLLALAEAGLRATILFWPVMLVLGALSTYVAWVPALGWFASWLLVALISLLIPNGSVKFD